MDRERSFEYLEKLQRHQDNLNRLDGFRWRGTFYRDGVGMKPEKTTPFPSRGTIRFDLPSEVLKKNGYS